MSAATHSRSRGLDLEQQRKRAKDLVREHRTALNAAGERILRHLPRARGLSMDAVLAAPFALSEAQLVVAREAGFASWARLKRAIELERLGGDVRLEAALDAALAGAAERVRALLVAEPELARGSLHLAAALGDTEAVLAAVEREPGLVHERGGLRRWSPLFYVCSGRLGRGEASIAQARARIAARLITLGANANEEIESYAAPGGVRSVLQAAACEAASPDLVEVLLAAGASVQPTGAAAGPVFPLTDAVRGGDLGCVRRVLDAQPELWQLREALEVAIEADRVDLCRLLLERGADANGAGRWWGQHGTCLHTAVLLERGPELVEALLASSVRLDATDRDGRSALALARRTGNTAVVELLRRHGASDARWDGVDELVRACLAGEGDTARALRAAQPGLAATLRRTDHQVLCWALRRGRSAAVALLLESGFDPNVADDCGETPLHLAAARGDAASVAELERAGASPAARNFDGQTPFDPETPEDRAERHALFEQAVRAVIDGDVETLRELCDAEPDLVHQRSPRFHRCTLLHYVAANGVERQSTPPNAPRVAELLLARGADADALAHTYGGGPGQTTLGLALTSVHPARAGVMVELVRALLRGGAKVDGLEGNAGPLLGALGAGQRGAVDALVEAGARLPSLLAAAGAGRLDLVRGFVDAAEPAERERALLAACRLDRRDVAEELLARGVPIDAADEQKFTGLHWAGWQASLGTLELLLARRAPLELRNVYGGTVLGTTLFAARHAFPDQDHAAAVERLCAAGARLDAVHQSWTGLAPVDAVLRRHGFRPESG